VTVFVEHTVMEGGCAHKTVCWKIKMGGESVL